MRICTGAVRLLALAAGANVSVPRAVFTSTILPSNSTRSVPLPVIVTPAAGVTVRVPAPAANSSVTRTGESYAPVVWSTSVTQIGGLKVSGVYSAVTGVMRGTTVRGAWVRGTTAVA